MKIPRPHPNHGYHVWDGDILTSLADILVCPVNCIPGVMGKGLAKLFAEKYPKLKEDHRFACESGALSIGCPRLAKTYTPYPAPHSGGTVNDIVLFPTKHDWRNKSRYDWVFRGLAGLYPILYRHEALSEKTIDIGFPALGCGEGGLDWDVIEPMIRAWAAGLPRRYGVTLYRPQETT